MTLEEAYEYCKGQSMEYMIEFLEEQTASSHYDVMCFLELNI